MAPPHLAASDDVTLSPSIVSSFENRHIRTLLIRTLSEDFTTIEVPFAKELAQLTLDKLFNAGTNYTRAAQSLAKETYSNWNGSNVKSLYQDYNWRIERAGSAEISNSFLHGGSHVDIGGGPGTFALELLKFKHTKQWDITLGDISDYRNKQAKENSQIHFQQLRTTEPPSFESNQFDSASLMFALHHVEDDHATFLKQWAKCIRKTLIIFEDVLIDKLVGPPEGLFRPARPIEKEFFKLNLQDQHMYMAGIDYLCNHLVNQAFSMPVPAKYYEYSELGQLLQNIFPEAKIISRFHGMYDIKCFPNPEAMYVVEFNPEK